MVEESIYDAVLHDVPVSGFRLGECGNGKRHSCRQRDGGNPFNEHRVLLTGIADLKVGTTSGAIGGPT